MPIEPTPYQEFDPDDVFEEIPFPLDPWKPGLSANSIEEVYCCKCADADISACAVENGFGEVYTMAVAQTLAFWFYAP
jgi:hypothetical protein